MRDLHTNQHWENQIIRILSSNNQNRARVAHRPKDDKAFIQSAGQVNISLTQSQNIRIALPPLNEQVRIVEEVRKWFTYVNAIDNNSCELEELIGNTKKNILRMAIQGKLVLLGHKEVNRTTNLLTFPIIVHVDSINLSILSYMRSTQNVLTLRELPLLSCHIKIIVCTKRGFCKGSDYSANNPFSSPK